jgi:hypothetical protein
MTTTGTSGEPLRGVLDAAAEHERTPYEAFPDVGHRIDDGRITRDWLTDDEPGLVPQPGVHPEASPEA